MADRNLQHVILSTQIGMVPTYVDDSLKDMEHMFRAFIERG